MLAVLERHDVEFVVVGGYAARLHGAARPTSDVDVTPRTTRDNLDRLASALRELGARIRSVANPDGFRFDVSGESLAGVRMLNLQTDHGDLDLAIRPAAFENGYDDLIDRSTMHTVGRLQVRIAALDDVIKSKETAARLKDLQALPELYRLAGNPAPGSFPAPAQKAAATPKSKPTAAERIAAARAQVQRRQDIDGEPGVEHD
ncbi:hypothetical protein DQ238_08910 [Geodermatophilus sp. TF02-6]|uniref:hypothetical protein n=1 Tax=Geodermatophilus sp. TF02-6 TaxID=2250575 RepID=UPI000DE83A8D|nr:hypothetical protein [Geodermatophilus sp. TF02-6]RBY79761.1 hypothetical protein DQ238_08910 [Geodermatophilus sp. TF02-6]